MTLRTLKRFDNDITWYDFYALLSIDFLNFNPFSVCSQTIFFVSLDKGLKSRSSLFPGISSEVLLTSFYVGLSIFEEIFCWIVSATFRWVVVLFSFRLNPHRTNYVFNEYKKGLKTSHWLNKVCLRLISRSDLCFLKSLLKMVLNKERQRNRLIHKT